MGCYVCRLLGGELQLREHTDFRWLGAGELNSVEWLPADVEVLPYVATLLK
jgi:8-oxo-dGTP diphosphatase